MSYYRALDTVAGAAYWQAGLFDANGTAIDVCETNPTPCSSPNNQVPVSRTGLNTTGLFFGIYCDATSPSVCTPGGSEHSVQAQMYSIAVTLSETALPSVSNLAGPLWTGGVVWGTQTVTFAASDPSGIAQIALDGAGGQVALQPQSCNYAQTQPCPDLPAGSVSVNTAMLADGTQTLSLLVTNAAGNTQTVQSPSIVVDNNGPPAPEQLAASPIAGEHHRRPAHLERSGQPPATRFERPSGNLPGIVRIPGRVGSERVRAASGARTRNVRRPALADRHRRPRRTIERRDRHSHRPPGRGDRRSHLSISHTSSPVTS